MCSVNYMPTVGHALARDPWTR